MARAALLWSVLLFMALLLGLALMGSTSQVCIAGQVVAIGSPPSTTPVVCE
jgi:uncharacterized protein HemY